MCALLVILLSISNLGTALAAAYLAKEVSYGSNGELTTKHGDAVSTVARASMTLTALPAELRCSSYDGNSNIVSCVSGGDVFDAVDILRTGSTVMFSTMMNGADDSIFQSYQLGGNGFVVNGTYTVPFTWGISFLEDENGFYCDSSGVGSGNSNSRRLSATRGLNTKLFKPKCDNVESSKPPNNRIISAKRRNYYLV